MKEPSLKANKAIQLANVRGRLCKSLLVSQDKKTIYANGLYKKKDAFFKASFFYNA